ncbi:probable F-box protein At4g22030 [Euphorbia lathyris]|uniref:probable F-box protein At4g22030 n=1 Tax=Euphorbia lathyris TaxID=212925 RepID=UPI0033143D6E
MMLSSSSISSTICCRRITKATINTPKVLNTIKPLSFPKISRGGLVKDLNLRNDYTIPTISPTSTPENHMKSHDPMVISKLYAIMEAVADRAEMHKNIGEQRDNWNHLLLNSINLITLTASTMCGFAATNPSFKLSSSILYVAATVFLGVMNTIQPSQLAEEQRNATRLFKQLHSQIETLVSIGNPTINDVKEAMEKVLGIDKAYPLPLLGVMLEKFPKKVQPAVWWPEKIRAKKGKLGQSDGIPNGWNRELEDEMREIVRVLKRKDKEDYMKLGEKALKFNKFLAISGPILTGIGAFGAFFADNPWGVTIGVLCGVLSSILSTIEHGGQVGMVFEMYRSNAGFFKLMEEEIESSLSESMVDRRENGELMEMKVALKLGRSISEVKDLGCGKNGVECHEFASKLF